jgi:hypothetical protein
MTSFTMPYHCGVIQVYFSYTKGWGGNREEPPEPDEMEIEFVYYNGNDVTEIVDLDTIEEYFWRNIDTIKEELNEM